MRTFVLITNAAVAIVFAAFFAYTFLGRQHIDGLAREFVTTKTRKLVTPAVDAAEQALRADLTRRLLTADQLSAIEAEFTEFRSEPARYIQHLTSTHAPRKPDTFLAKLSEKIFGWKERIRAHYNRVLGRLFTDLRIFSGSNVIAACIGFFCAWQSPGRPSPQLILISTLLLVAIGLSVYFYIDHFSFFTILFDWYFGWAYPVLMAALFISIYMDYASRRNAIVT